MKKIINISLILLITTQVNGQIASNLSIDLNFGRYAKNSGVFKSEYYENEFTYLNGFDIGYAYSTKINYFTGFRKLNSKIHSGDGFVLETTSVKGIEINAGIEYLPNRERKLFFSYAIELFGEFSKQKGTYWVDYPPTYEINHKKNYLGVAPSLKINFRLKNGIVIFADARYRIGKVNLMGIASTQADKELFSNRKYRSRLFEPLNSIGIKIELGYRPAATKG